MTTLQKTIVTATIAVLAGAGIYEARQVSQLREQNQAIQQQQAPLAEENQQLQRQRDEAINRLRGLRDELASANRNNLELLKLRGATTQLRNELNQIKQTKTKNADDPLGLEAQAWIERVKTLKDRFDHWPGKTTPELQLLDQQDWLNEAAKHELNTDADLREAMSRLRWTAKTKFAPIVNQALVEYTNANNGQLPTDISQLQSFLKPPATSILNGYEIAKPGWVHPPQPNSPDSKNAETWALVMKGSFTPDGIAIRDGSYLGDPDHDMTMIIYNGSGGGGWYGYGPDNTQNK